VTERRAKLRVAAPEAAEETVPLPERDVLRVVTVGHVDHGKSTLIGRLLHDTGSLPTGKVEAVAEMSRRRGMSFEWAFVTDALRAERDQGITIDVSHIWFRTATREYVLLDAPGHREFLRNMVTGAAASDAALLVIDAEEGVRDQSRRHAYLLAMLGHRQIAVAVNKMDLVGYSAERFAEVAAEIAAHLTTLGVAAAQIVPVVSRDGDNIVVRSEKMAWYAGPTLIDVLNRFQRALPAPDQPLRLPIQDVYKFDARRIIVGRVESGRLAVGDELLFSPSGKRSRIASIEAWTGTAPNSAGAGEVVGITLDEQIYVARGDVASHPDDPPMLTDVFDARLFWLSPNPLRTGQQYTMRLNTAEIPIVIEEIKRVLDLADQAAAQATDAIERDNVAEVVIRAKRLIAVDDRRQSLRTGRFVVTDGGVVFGGGLIDMSAWPDQRKLMLQKATNLTAVDHRIELGARLRRNGHAGGVLWLTGLSGAGKSTLAVAAEQRLFALGYQTYLLDGDNVRRGLNANLGFAPDDRAENIRRIGEVAALFADAGMIAITAFISPYRSDRERARAAAQHHAHPIDFHEIYIKADLATCEGRDPKGLYKRARAGQIEQFTGISAPYEPPERAELEVDTARLDIERSVERIVDFVRQRFPLRGDRGRG
jgi:bifunctional enzyme CysN/CysC